jgi:hypothetical protein
MTFINIVFLFPADLAPSVPDMNYGTALLCQNACAHILTAAFIAVVVMGGVMIGSLIWYWFPKVRNAVTRILLGY